MQNHNTLKNIYGEPLKPCKTGTKPGSWDNEGYCSEKGGGVHQICMNVTEERSDFSTKLVKVIGQKIELEIIIVCV